MDRVYDIDKEKLNASLNELYSHIPWDNIVWDNISVRVHIDSEEHKVWFEGISSNVKSWVENAFYNDLFGEKITDENDLTFIGEIIDTKNEIAKQITEGIEHNIATCRKTIEQIDNDSNLYRPLGFAKSSPSNAEKATNPLSTAIQDFQKAVASYLNNENISRYSWGLETLANYVKDCVRVNNKVAVSVNDLNFNVGVSFDMDGTVYLKKEEGMTDREIAEKMVRRADYFITDNEYIQGADTLYELALDVIKYDEIVKQIEGAKDSLAITFVKASGDKDKLLADNDLYFEWFKDTFGHSFGKDNGYDDEAMLNHRFAQMVESGRISAEKVFGAEINEAEEIRTYDYYECGLDDKVVVVFDSSTTEHEVSLIPRKQFEYYRETCLEQAKYESSGITIKYNKDDVTAEVEEAKPNIAEIKAPSVINPYSMTLMDKANEIKELIDNCTIRSEEKGRPTKIEVWSDISDRGDNVGSIKIVNGGEAIKLSYNGQNCTGAKYNDHIFHHGEWKYATDVYDNGAMKNVLHDIYSHLNQASEFNPTLDDPETKNQNRNKGNTTPKR